MIQPNHQLIIQNTTQVSVEDLTGDYAKTKLLSLGIAAKRGLFSTS
jgi:hypothetical protein